MPLTLEELVATAIYIGMLFLNLSLRNTFR